MTTIVESKKSGDDREFNFYYEKVKRGGSFRRDIVNSDFNTIVLLLIDLEREGFQAARAARKFLEIMDDKDKDWLF